MSDKDDDIRIQLSGLDEKISNILEKLDDIKGVQKCDGAFISKINEKLPVHELRIDNIENSMYGSRISNIEKDVKKLEGSFLVFKYIWYIITIMLSTIF